ncbi:hypothetical protein SRS16CHR_05224 [Variovorax sp. SRS16]|nr:hypothetical protein SRS16CHR_05224 [Variovorax sp. SRS16]
MAHQVVQLFVSTAPPSEAFVTDIGDFALLSEHPVSMNRPGFVKLIFSVSVAAVTLSAAGWANAEVSWSIGVGGPVYYEPAPVYSNPPPVYYQPAPPAYYAPPPPVYYDPQPAYYAPPRPAEYEPGYWQGPPPAEQPRLSDMQRRALDNCSMLSWRDQPRCRATVMSTVR